MVCSLPAHNAATAAQELRVSFGPAKKNSWRSPSIWASRLGKFGCFTRELFAAEFLLLSLITATVRFSTRRAENAQFTGLAQFSAGLGRSGIRIGKARQRGKRSAIRVQGQAKELFSALRRSKNELVGSTCSPNWESQMGCQVRTRY